MVDVPTDLAFLPRPWRLARQEGAFPLDAATRIQIGRAAGEATVRAARALQTALADACGLTPDIVPATAPAVRNAVSLVLVGRDEEVFPTGTVGREWSADLGPQGYALRVPPAGATVAAEGEAGLFYGVQTLIQLAQSAGRFWPALAVEDRPALRVRGVMLDVSRMKVPTLATLERLEPVMNFATGSVRSTPIHRRSWRRISVRSPSEPRGLRAGPSPAPASGALGAPGA
ncbi:MAG: beta-N-acetylhexosaminidase, partial [Chloroflexota bacterium]|nr:beta-N-acetylhexosaminidase [Chloroflexota bacterium]